jgi:hypothetical protein
MSNLCLVADGSSSKLELHLKDEVKAMSSILSNGIPVLINMKH